MKDIFELFQTDNPIFTGGIGLGIDVILVLHEF